MIELLFDFSSAAAFYWCEAAHGHDDARRLGRALFDGTAEPFRGADRLDMIDAWLTRGGW